MIVSGGRIRIVPGVLAGSNTPLPAGGVRAHGPVHRWFRSPPFPKKQLGEYRRIAKIAGKVWREHGALDYRDCVADDAMKNPRLAGMDPKKMPSTRTAWSRAASTRS
jgi:hypothetical protein